MWQRNSPSESYHSSDLLRLNFDQRLPWIMFRGKIHLCTGCLCQNEEYSHYSGSVVKTQIQSFYNELIYVVEEGEGCFPYAA